ncbi:hypothetical protein D8674_006678 [Pyrus ussuriensis x Pyrus communis]|uniref:Reverse transcriptase Ty1/copia-type domain-containing protein n=1 Tax=Pyrus ussuriensis x Pyrus communis TaxID=2448454 RepID=A0A5N5FZE8_9ROSA|nr:hypothetical protein D8674_006678 [Pyrus ussuriensis x Pyrus communis]
MADNQAVSHVMGLAQALNEFSNPTSSAHCQISSQRVGLADPKAQIQVGQQAGHADTSVGPISRVSSEGTKGLLSPPAANCQFFGHASDPEPNNLDKQLSLLNLISSQEQYDDPSKIGIAFTTSTKRDSGWIIDSGATDHMTYDESLFHHLTVPPKEYPIMVENILILNYHNFLQNTTYFTKLLVLKLLNNMVWQNVRTYIYWKLNGGTGEAETEDLGVMSNPPDCALPERRDTTSQSLVDLDCETLDREITHAASNSRPTPFMDLFDVKNVFLHGDLEEEVYMDLPPGYETSNEARKVCRLRKALYGLKQSPRAWFGRFTEAMKKYGYRQGNADHTLFIKCMGVSVVSQFMHAPSEDHMAAVIGLIFKTHGYMEVKGYTDVDWSGNITDRRSTSGYFTFVAGNLAEYRGMTHRICELLWFRILLIEIGFKL